MTILAILIPLLLGGTGRCESYALQRDTGSGWTHAAHYGPGLSVKIPHALPDTVWASQSTARYAWASYRLGCACAGDTTWSPALLVADASAWPDTNAFIEIGTAQHAVRTPGRWTVAEGSRLTHQETVQRRLSRRIVELFGYWVAARGERFTEPVE